MIILLTTIVYFSLLLIISRFVGKGGNDEFFRGNRQSPWLLVAFGMVGASLSGVTFISVPGMVMSVNMTYMQVCLGYILGYATVAFVLLPIYYKNHLTSIYTYLGQKLGKYSYKTGASFFLISKLTGAAARLYLVCVVLQNYILDELGVPYVVTVVSILILIWLYTRKSGIKALVWTDVLQTSFFLITLVLIFNKATEMLGYNVCESVQAVLTHPHGQIFDFGDWTSRTNFWKQFISGIFIVIVMTGLDQDMMQKNLTCKDLPSAQKDMCTSAFLFIPVNFICLALGVILLILYEKNGMPLPQAGDRLLPDFVASGIMGQAVLVFFTIGIVSSAFSSADSAMTALTTSFCIDILEIEKRSETQLKLSRENIRKIVHISMMTVFVLFILLFKAVNNPNIIDAIFVLAGYTYGPLLGMFAFGMFAKNRQANDKVVPFVAVASPIVCYAVSYLCQQYASYTFGYELLLLNGALTFGGIWFSAKRKMEVLG